MEILIGVLIVASIVALFYGYGVLLGKMLTKKTIKQINSGKLTDKKILRLYKGYDAKNAIVFLLFGIILYPPIKKAFALNRENLLQEINKRGLAVD
ncbi:MAG: hypothetical protein ACRC6X_01575 [Culicoidibacterales bacterium]